jgi:hypothetical protein
MSGDCQADILQKTWEVYSTSTTKIFNSDRILLSASRENTTDCFKKITAHGQQIMEIQPVIVSEFKDHQFQHTLENAAGITTEVGAFSNFNGLRLRRYVSPFMLNSALSGFDDKFEAVLAVDTAMAIIETFQDSHQMTAQNLMNMYLAEELQECLPDVVITAIYSLLLSHR